MPMKPAKAEQMAPMIKETATNGEESTPAVKARMAATTITKIESTRYSAFKNDMAPSAMFFAILAILSLPTSCLVTQEDFQKVKRSPMTPNTGIM